MQTPSPTLFSKIIDGTLPAQKVYEDAWCCAFWDREPQAPVHVLVVPKKEIPSLAQVSEEDREILGHLLVQIPKIAHHLGIADFRVISNAGEGAGQTVFHLHFHLLGGKVLGPLLPPFEGKGGSG